MLVVDRFEEDKAVVFDDEKQIILDRDKLSPFVKEGDAVIGDKGFGLQRAMRSSFRIAVSMFPIKRKRSR